jgi:predicted MFS family arabinose efflux permease
MTLPGDVLSPKSRSLGMSVFFTIYSVAMMVGPSLGSGLSEPAGDAGMAILTGAGMSLATALSLLLFRRATI